MPSARTAAVLQQQEEPSLRRRIMQLVGTASLEAAVKNVADVDAYPGFLPAGTAVYLPWLPGLPFSHVISVAARLRQAGFEPVPHIAARRVVDRASAEDFVSRLAGEAGVKRALIIAGDVDRPVGPFDSAVAFLESGLLQQHGYRTVGVAGYPEGHPRVSEAQLEAALKRKIEIGQATGLELQLVSQFCFDGAAIERWIARLHAAGVSLPVHVGLAGPASMRTLINYGIRCGIGASLRALRSHGVSLTRLAAQTGPEAVVRHLAEASDRGVLPLPLHLHFFSFGGVEKCARWMGAAAEGRFQLRGTQFDLID